MRAISLASRFLVTLVVSAVLPLLLYGWFSLRSMREQIDEQVVRVFLPQLAADHAQKIEAYLERTYQACAIVREIARRALQTRSADKLTSEEEMRARAIELEAFEEQVEPVPDLLDNYLDLLLLADDTGAVVYWKDGHYLDPNTHGQRAAAMPASVADTEWFARAQLETSAFYLPLGVPYLRACTGARPRDPAAHHLALAIDVPCTGRRPGALLALIRW